MKIEDRIYEAIIADLSDRRGLRHEWEQTDSETIGEIRETWVGIINAELTRLRAELGEQSKALSAIDHLVRDVAKMEASVFDVNDNCEQLVKFIADEIVPFAEAGRRLPLLATGEQAYPWMDVWVRNGDHPPLLICGDEGLFSGPTDRRLWSECYPSEASVLEALRAAEQEGDEK